MLESLNRKIDVEALMLRLRGRVSDLEQQGHHELLPSDAVALRNSVFINSLEAFVNTADQKAQIRVQWPSLLAGFFFNIPTMRRALLDGLAFLFKDQRHVNLALVAAFRESISLNRQLIEQFDLLRKDHEDLKKNAGRDFSG